MNKTLDFILPFFLFACLLLSHSSPVLAQRSVGESYKMSETELKQLLKSAKQGDVNAQFRAYELYRDGNGVKKDAKEASKWLNLAVDNGYAEAQFRMAIEAISEDYSISSIRVAVPLMRRAALQGYVYAQDQYAGFFQYVLCKSENDREKLWFQTLLSDEGYGDSMAAALWWYRRASDRSVDSRVIANDIAKNLTVHYPSLPEDSFVFPYEIPRIHQIDHWCFHYEALCRKQLPAMMKGYDVPDEMLKYDPCLVWLILKNPEWDRKTKNNTMDAYKMPLNTVKSIYELYAQLLRKQYDLSLPPMQRMD